MMLLHVLMARDPRRMKLAMLFSLLALAGWITTPAAATLGNLFTDTSADDYAVVHAGRKNTGLSLNRGRIFGDVAIGPGGVLAMSGDLIRGTVEAYPDVRVCWTEGAITGGIVFDPGTPHAVDGRLEKAIAGAVQASLKIADLKPTGKYGIIDKSTTFMGNGGVNVINVDAFKLSGGTVLLYGGPNDVFYINVARFMRLSNGSQILVIGGADYRNVVFNMPSRGNKARIAGGSILYGTILNVDGGVDLGDSEGGGAGSIYGGIVGGDINLTQGSLVSQAALTDPPAVTPEGSSLLLLSVGLLPLIGAARLARKRR